MNYDVILNANDAATLETQYAFTQGDYGNIQFSIRVKADGQYVTDATRAYIVFTLPNGMIVTGADMPKSVATYTYVFQGNELQAPGKIVADVKLVYANGQISSNKFTFTCRPDPLADKSIPAGPYITTLQKIVDEGQEKIDYLQALIDTLQEGVGETAVTRNDLQNNRDPVDAGLKAIDANMAQNLFFKSEVINANTTTTAGFAADARQLNPSVPGSLAAQLATTNSNLALKANASDLDNKAAKTSNNTLTAKNYYTQAVGLDNQSYRNAGINIRVLAADASWARPGIALEREGVEGAYIYFENGKLYYIDNAGVKHTISST